MRWWACLKKNLVVGENPKGLGGEMNEGGQHMMPLCPASERPRAAREGAGVAAAPVADGISKTAVRQG
jgi:hypothetical protein